MGVLNMILNKFGRLLTRRTTAATSKRAFAQLVNHETSQPPKEGSVSDYHLDTHMANSKYYNPHTFDPQLLEYQEDVRLLQRVELPDEIESSDVAENLYGQVFMTELLWPPMVYGGWAAFEPDHVIHYPWEKGTLSPMFRGEHALRRYPTVKKDALLANFVKLPALLSLSLLNLNPALMDLAELLNMILI